MLALTAWLCPAFLPNALLPFCQVSQEFRAWSQGLRGTSAGQIDLMGRLRPILEQSAVARTTCPHPV
jgi:hypothetical protein